jgi:hypothetical protein
MGYKEPMLNLFTSMTRGVGTMILFVMVALFWLGCDSHTNKAMDRKQREESKKVLDSQHGGATDAIRDYQLHKTRPAGPKKDK